ncbi:ferritin-like domain-containing protein [Dyadobacter sp. CY345]|uniref:DUF892 family protein n=1 Tax=Dyadobacter sp. CY345 TaxID=2909335 RepID=UPI001F190200|nr:DUF892 family protein [Dyadobacter sp. CY345]MCF2447329.1 ferritin-like domain-containing protein [Dyadobacter sp. CY345]
MDKDQKKIRYQELFLSELRNSHFGEKKIEDALREMETKTNMEKLASALKSIWKKTDENIKELETVFPKSEIKTPVPVNHSTDNEEVKVTFEPLKIKSGKTEMEKKHHTTTDMTNFQVVSYDHLLALVEELDIDQVKEILSSVTIEEKSSHQYLSKLAETLLKDSEVKKVPDSKP